MISGCSVATPTLIYAWPATKEEFDRIAIAEMVHEWRPCRTTTVLKDDGQEWERRCHSKAIGDVVSEPVSVIFQWFEERPVPREGERHA